MIEQKKTEHIGPFRLTPRQKKSIEKYYKKNSKKFGVFTLTDFVFFCIEKACTKKG